MEGKSSIQNAEIERFFLRFCQLIMSNVSKSVRYSDLKTFHQRIIANMPSNVTEIVRIPKMHEISFKKRWVY